MLEQGEINDINYGDKEGIWESNLANELEAKNEAAIADVIPATVEAPVLDASVEDDESGEVQQSHRESQRPIVSNNWHGNMKLINYDDYHGK